VPHAFIQILRFIPVNTDVFLLDFYCIIFVCLTVQPTEQALHQMNASV